MPLVSKLGLGPMQTATYTLQHYDDFNEIIHDATYLKIKVFSLGMPILKLTHPRFIISLMMPGVASI